MSAQGPDIASLLAHMAGGGGPPGMQAGPPPQEGPEQAGGEDQVPDLLKQALDLIHKAFAIETEPIDKQALAKILADIQTLFAQEQKEKDQAMGGSGMRLLRRNR